MRVCLGFPLLTQEVDSGSSHVSRPALQVRRCCHVPCSWIPRLEWCMERMREFRDHGEGLKAIQCFPLGRELSGSKEAGQEISRLSRMGRNSVLKRQETKGYLTQLPPLQCAHSPVTRSSRTGNVCCHCRGGVPANRDKRQVQELPGKAALLILGSGLTQDCSLKLSMCLTCEASSTGLPLICPPSPTPPPIHFHSHHVVLTPPLLLPCFCPVPPHYCPTGQLIQLHAHYA